MLELTDLRVLICGSRRWPWPATVEGVLDRLAARHNDRLVVIEGAAAGADWAAHLWCGAHGLGADRHRCYPVDWEAERRTRPHQWRQAGPERNTRMLVKERPQLIIAFHERLDPAAGGTSDMCVRGLLSAVPVWLMPGQDPQAGRWLRLAEFPQPRVARIRRELDAAILSRQPGLFGDGSDELP
ncbi:SLOG family protein [Streptomyces nigra]|nr:DUF2493 domain-containing protein [Streptomyces sp. RK62]